MRSGFEGLADCFLIEINEIYGTEECEGYFKGKDEGVVFDCSEASLLEDCSEHEGLEEYSNA